MRTIKIEIHDLHKMRDLAMGEGKPDVLRSRFWSVLLHHFLTIDSFIYGGGIVKRLSQSKLVSNV